MREMLPARVRFAGFELDLKTGELRAGDDKSVLQEQPLQILRMLVEREGELVTREEIRKKLWPNDTIVEFDHSINAAIRILRRALGDSADAPKYIETLARRGYRLMVPVEWVEQGAEAATPPSPAASGERAVPEPAEGAGVALTGRTVSHYRVLHIIGGGGMGVVYRAEDLKLGRQVALKFLPEELGSEPQALERFSREARAASSLDHPNICPIFEFGEHEGRPFIVMQLLEGQTLRDRLVANEMPKPLPLEEVLDIGIQVSHGLQAAHEKGVIHRDIKPANIFLTSKGVVKILDFGLAKLVEGEVHPSEIGLGPALSLSKGGAPAVNSSVILNDEVVSQRETTEESKDPYSPENPDGIGVPRLAAPTPGRSLGMTPEKNTPAAPTLTRTGVAMGTVGYMSPEQARGEELDARTDLFSLGLVLYEMGTGRRAFMGETAYVVHEAILHQSPVPARDFNSNLPPKLVRTIDKALEKERDRRWQSAAQMGSELEQVRGAKGPRTSWQWTWLPLAALLLVVVAVGVWRYLRARHTPRLTEKDAIVLMDFDNKTGDLVFDETLKQAVAVDLGQSPFLNIVSDRKVMATLRLMGRPLDQSVTGEVAREVCQRVGGKAMLAGSISAAGSNYVIGLDAINCATGDVLVRQQVQARGKEDVLAALGNAATDMRGKLGESLVSVQNFATPIEEASTSSLEALKAYSMGRREGYFKADVASIPYYQQALELDPDFALAARGLATAYNNLGQTNRALEYSRKAFELRKRVSERERYAITARYYSDVTGQLEKANEVYELYKQRYPRDFIPLANLADSYMRLGEWDKALRENEGAIQLEPNAGVAYTNLALSQLALNHADQAVATVQQAMVRNIDFHYLRLARYQAAFLRGDQDGMQQQVTWAAGRPKEEDWLLSTQSDTEAYFGRLGKAREFSRRAVMSAAHADANETGALWQANAALREAEFGNAPSARQNAMAALALAPGKEVKSVAALALAQAGDTARAQKLADSLDQESPLNTIIQGYWLPAIRAAIAISQKNPNQALRLLQAATAYELSQSQPFLVGMLYPVYLRGQAYLLAQQGEEAAAEFRKIIDHRGIVLNFPLGALARLGLARAYALDAAKDAAARDKARTAYQDFLALWKDADLDIPIYKQAKAEYAKLQ